MKHFFVLYKMPIQRLESWMKVPEEERKEQESALKEEWDTWLKEHAPAVHGTSGLGKTKLVNTEGVSDTKNDLLLFSYIDAESQEMAAEVFKDHPHLKIPGATIEIMETQLL